MTIVSAGILKRFKISWSSYMDIRVCLIAPPTEKLVLSSQHAFPTTSCLFALAGTGQRWTCCTSVLYRSGKYNFYIRLEQFLCIEMFLPWPLLFSYIYIYITKLITRCLRSCAYVTFLIRYFLQWIDTGTIIEYPACENHGIVNCSWLCGYANTR